MIRSLILLLCLTTMLTGCFPWLYKIEVQQGNIIEQVQLDQLEEGMNKEQVRFLLGSPVLNDALGNDIWDYYLSIKDIQGVTRSYWVQVKFQQDKYQQYIVREELFDLKNNSL